MSKERELLQRLVDSGVLGGYSFIAEVKELLAQPEPFTPDWVNYRQGVEDSNREPLSDGTTADMWHANKKATHADSYWAGVSDAEKAHGITGVYDETL